MSELDDKREQYAREVLATLPSSLGFELFTVSTHLFELRSRHCIIRLGFEQFESSRSMLEFASPADRNNGMAYWVLRHIRGVAVTEDEKSSATSFGRKLVHYFRDVIGGDFSIQRDYDLLSDRIMDRMFEVRRLPKDDPTRILFDAFDIRWLHDLEKSS